MNWSDEKVHDLATYQQRILSQRKNHWRNLFDKYATHQAEKQEEDDADMSVEDIVKVYAISKRPRKYAEANNTGICNTSRKRNENVVPGTKNVACLKTERDAGEACNESNLEKSGTTRRRGRPPKNNSKIKIEEVKDGDTHEIDNEPVNRKNGPKLQCKVYTAGEEYNEPLIKAKNNVEQNETIRKRGRPPKINNSEIKIEEVKDSDKDIDKETVNRKKGRPKLHCKVNTEVDAGEGYDEPFIKPENNVEQNESIRKRGRPRKINNSEIKIEEVKDSDIHEIDKETVKRKKGRPKLFCKINTQIDAGEGYDEPLIKLESNVEETEIIRKRGRPPTKNTSKIKIEEVKENIDEPERETFAEIKMKNTSTQNVVVRKSGRLNLKNSAKGNQNTSRSPVKDFPENQNKDTEKEFNATSLKTRDRPQLNKKKASKTKPANVKNKLTSPSYEKYIVHSFSKKELQEKYPDLIQNEKRLSRSFAITSKFNQNSRRSKSCINYSEKSLTRMHLSCANNPKGKSSEKENSSTTLSHTPPRMALHNKNSGKTLALNQPLRKADEKENAISDTSQFDTLDSNMLYTKYVVEEKLKSNLGLLMIKRHCNLQSASEGKENNFNLWHNAVKSELIKLHRVVPMKKLEQYVEWYVTAWFSQAANAE